MVASELQVEIFLDGCDAIWENRKNNLVAGFTSNPTLMVKAGIRNYEDFAKVILREITDKPIAFEVLSDDFDTMHKQALKIASWGNNVNVKIPITNTKDETSIPLIEELIKEGVRVNVTAITLLSQVVPLLPVMRKAKDGYISIFAGRISDCGQSAEETMKKAAYLINDKCPQINLIWASAREIYNVIQADQCGCDIITIGSDLLKKLPLLGKDLKAMSLDTVKLFATDALNFKL